MSEIDHEKELSRRLGDYLPKPKIEVEIDTAEIEKAVEKIEKLTDRVEKAIALLDKLSYTIE